MGTKLNSILKEFLVQLGDSNLNRYARFYLLAVNYLREANSDSMDGVPKIVELCVSDMDTASLPSDYIDYNIIGICGKDGKIHSLGRNDKICGDNCRNNQQSVSPFSITTSSAFVGYNLFSTDTLSQSWKNGEFVGKMYGVSGGNNSNGEFRIDMDNGLIHLLNLANSSDTIVMEYKANLSAINDDFEVHPYLIDTLKKSIYLQSIEFDRNFSIGQKEQAKRSYDIAERWSRKRFKQASISEWYQAFRSGNTASVKW